ncbi:glycerophosphodiester phosphodiesterase family protein [Aestuariibacter sp. AA17]|uniref:Glycerophosphodiester phosphodiesterase family protein n=1 Tax=Fluctibacter corallii TaxID=2984329 RepID=A0ABT3A6U7_9ALTE|nr:glycerophosphodiester phosphodiesterase family protein [Aestuariibacter sp. AA17]MCV2884410.1 glycerophosphodiester phosphodiesterase family protein [Aestuariibacter sp. AA17]
MIIFAHRGASKDKPENTLSAIEEAIKQQADAIEIDVFECKDEFVVIHDRWLQRTTTGHGKVENHTYAQLSQFDAGLGQPIPTLNQVLDMVNGKCELNIELKGVHQTAHLLDYIHPTHFDNTPILFSSFNHHVIKHIKQLKPDCKIGALTSSVPLNYAAFASELGAYSTHLDISFCTQAFVDDIHLRGMKAYVYTVDELEDIVLMNDMGVDGIFTNKPAFAKTVLSHMAQSQ